MKYGDLFREGIAALQLAAIADAQIDARLLLEYVCHTTRNDLLAHPEREVSPDEEEKYRILLKRRIQHEPLQYIVGVCEFMGLEFMVNESTLIPRQDTETLVEEALLKLHDGMRILDVCTGTGCILLSLLHYSNDCVGTGTDIHEDIIALARSNSVKMGIEAQFIQSDLFENIEDKYDMIVSNPPYIRSREIETLQDEVKSHEPMSALDGGEDGLFYYRIIATQAKAHLYGGGFLLLEVGYDQADEVAVILSQNGYKEIAKKKDLAGIERVVIGVI